MNKVHWLWMRFVRRCTGAHYPDGTIQHDGPTCPVHEAKNDD